MKQEERKQAHERSIGLSKSNDHWVHILDSVGRRLRDTSLSCTEVRKEAQRRKGTCPRSHSENLDLPFLALFFFLQKHTEITPRGSQSH